MRLNDWKREAEQFSDLDHAVMAQIEGDSAFAYFKHRGQWPEGLSTRAWAYLKAHESEVARQLPARNELERESGRRSY